MSRVFSNAGFTFIALPAVAGLNPTAPFSMAAWCMTTVTPGIASIFHFNLNIPIGAQLYFRCSSSLTPMFQYYDGSSFHGLAAFSSALTIGAWAQLTGTYDGTTYIAYFNGIAASAADAVGPSGTVPSNIQIGNDPNTSTRAWTGPIADVALWNVALKAGEAKALANGARPHMIRPLALKGYWPLDGLQSPEPDLSGNANNGTLNNPPIPLGVGPPVMMFTPRWPQNISAAGGGGTTVFRRSLSPIGTRVGSRQAVLS